MNEHEALQLAVDTAVKSPCSKSKRGVVIWTPSSYSGRAKDPIVAFNGPPPGFTCDGSADCREACGRVCVHAEARAVQQLRPGGDYTDLLHVKVVNGVAVASGGPSCWQCSRQILDVGLQRVWLLLEDGLRLYSARDFHVQTLRECKLPVIPDQAVFPTARKDEP